MPRWGWEAAVLAAVGPRLLADATGHDLAHALRVRNLALYIAAAERQRTGDAAAQASPAAADPALAAAAYLHDVFRDDSADGDKARSVAFAEATLARAGFPAALLPVVHACIRYHSWSARAQPEPPGLPPAVYVFRDADRLDALGAWGLARTFAYGGAHGRAIGFDAAPPDWETCDPDRPAAALRSSAASTIGHFHAKLLQLEAHMYTATARGLAAARHAALAAFLTQLEAEMGGPGADAAPAGSV